LTYGTLSARIIVDENMQSYTEIYDWVQRLVTENNTTRSIVVDEEFPTAVDITVSILNSQNNQVKAIRYIDCVPTDVGGIEFEATTQDVPVPNLQCDFPVFLL